MGQVDDDRVQAIVEALDETVAGLSAPPKAWRERWAGRLDKPPAMVEPEPLDDVMARALALVDATAEDGRQRALDHQAPSLEDLAELRRAVREQICSSSYSERRFVMPWLWRWESLGEPLTPTGRETGFELRFSRYEKPIC